MKCIMQIYSKLYEHKTKHTDGRDLHFFLIFSATSNSSIPPDVGKLLQKYNTSEHYKNHHRQQSLNWSIRQSADTLVAHGTV